MSLTIHPEYSTTLAALEQKKAADVRTRQDNGEKGDLEALQSRKQAIQNQIIMTKSTSDAAGTAEDTQKALQKQLDQISQQIDALEQTGEPQSETAPAISQRPRFDRYVKGDAVPEEVQSPEKTDGGEQEAKSTQTTISTDKVDAEIRRLRQASQEVKAQLDRTSADDPARAALEKELSGLESELNQKDNDGYRKQHAQIL